MRKHTARLRLPATRNVLTAFFSSLLANTSIASSGCLLAATRLLDHAKNAWPSTIPTTMKIGAGDTRTSENGAAAFATSGPHVWRLLKPNRMKAIAAAERTTPKRSILMLGWRGIGVRRKLRTKTTTAMATISQYE